MRAGLWRVVLILMSVCVGLGRGATNSVSGLDELRAEMEALRAAYESRLKGIERRVGELEDENAALRVRANIGDMTGTNRDVVADLRERVAELESRAERAREERGTLSAGLEQMQREGEATRILAERNRELFTETRDRYRDAGGLPLDMTNLWSLPRPFEYHAYFRSGVGLNGRNGEQTAFKAPGAGAKYRLGNETDTYAELELQHNWLNREDPLKKPYVSSHVMFAFITGNNQTFESVNATEDGNDLALRQAFVQGGNVFASAPEVRMWAGQRYYRRHDVHINDFYFLDMSGYGLGVENVPVAGPVNLHAAWLGGSDDSLQTGHGNAAKHNLDLRLSEIPAPGGSLTLWLDIAWLRGGTVTNLLDTGGDRVDLPSTGGWAAGVVHRTAEKAFLNGYNELAVQYGRGAAYNFATTLDAGVPDLDDVSRFRVTEHFTIQPVRWLSMQAVALFERTDLGRGGDAWINWASAGVRPILHFNERWSIAAEAGVDWVDNGPLGIKDALWKFTIAPQLSRGGEFFSRPVLRVYATYAKWGSDFEGRIGGPAFADDTEGLSAGVQVEAWW
jgi:maltoporin